MTNPRILYIDLMKGLSISWVVWYHTAHPEFVNYSFLMPLFFLASAIFFKPYPFKVFVEKKIYQLIIPFVIFYLAYYLFLIFFSYFSNKSFVDFDYGCIADVFKPYNANGAPVVNPPLWFIMALIDLQLTLYFCTKIIHNRLLLLIISIAISMWARFGLFETYTYFQFGRAMRYFCYYCFGYLYGKDIITTIENGARKSSNLFAICAGIFASAILIKSLVYTHWVHTIVDYLQITALIIMLMYLFRWAQHWWIMKPLKYYGANSYIVLGMNEIILTTILVIFLRLFGEMNITLGFVHWILTMILLIPVISWMNKHIPYLVGKKNLFEKLHG